MKLHAHIKKSLKREYGKDWWRKGINEKTRADLAQRLEMDPSPTSDKDNEDQKFCYTTFINLSDIIKKNWVEIFSKKDVFPEDFTKDKKQLLSDLLKINHIRNKAMHPLKNFKPTEQDFYFLKNFDSVIYKMDTLP